MCKGDLKFLFIIGILGCVVALMTLLPRTDSTAEQQAWEPAGYTGLRRAKVPGGWVYKCNDGAVVFVPDDGVPPN